MNPEKGPRGEVAAGAPEVHDTADDPREDPVAGRHYPIAPEYLEDLGRSDAPTPDLFYLAARGLHTWTKAQRAAIDASPRLVQYEKKWLEQARREPLREAGGPHQFAATRGPVPGAREWVLGLEESPRPALAAQTGVVDQFVNLMANMVLRVYRSGVDEYTIQFSGGWPGGRISLYSNGRRIPLRSGFEPEDHYAIVGKTDFDPVLDRRQLTVRQEE
jgi:hypothetical protein